MSQDTTVFSGRPEILSAADISKLVEARGIEATWRPTYSTEPDVPNGVFRVSGRTGSTDQIDISCRQLAAWEREEFLRVFGNKMTEAKRSAIAEAKTAYNISRSWSRDVARDFGVDNLIDVLAETTSGLVYDQQDNKVYSLQEYRALHAASLNPDPTVM